MVDHLDVRHGAYVDSVTLMQVSRRVGDVDGVEAAFVAMATELNLDLLGDMGFEVPSAGANDLMIAVRADEDVLTEALAALETALTASRSGGATTTFGDAPAPRTVRDAAALGGSLALVSTPGAHAYVESLDALRSGLHVMVFSDNVPIEHEIALKREGRDRGLLVMGPDAGTAIVAGVGLGFANVIAPGPVGIVAASGTGAQHLTCLLDDAGVGVSHVLGVGGRDLSVDVGGIAALQAIAALDADPTTELIVVLSKPPDESVADRVRAAADEAETPAVTAFVGRDGQDLTTVAEHVVHALGQDMEVPRRWPTPATHDGGARELRGLFAGGTLCDEAMAVAAGALGPIASNVPFDDGRALTDGLDTPGHVFVDLGEDEYTRGRPHPMIDQRLRLDRLAVEARRPGGRVVLLDVVLGHAAHPDPAGEMAPAIADAISTGEDLVVVVSMCGAAGDPQGRDRQVTKLVDAGASVHLSNADAARTAVELLGGAP